MKFDKTWYDQLVNETEEKKITLKNLEPLLYGCNGSCLDVGAGNFFFAEAFKDKFDRYVALEKEVYEKAPEGVEIVEGDWEEFETDEKFDVILAIHVVGYFKELGRSIKKLINTLKEGGKLIIVLNGKGGDYSRYRAFFRDLIGKEQVYTYDKVIDVLTDEKTKESYFNVDYDIDSYENIYNVLRLSFGRYEKEYSENKEKLINFMQETIKTGKFRIEQRIIEVTR